MRRVAIALVIAAVLCALLCCACSPLAGNDNGTEEHGYTQIALEV